MASGKKLQVEIPIKNTVEILLLAMLACFCVIFNAQAATAVAGAITANTTWTLAQSPYQITKDITIENGAVLTIEPGVVVFVEAFNNPDRNLTIVSGAVNAVGTTTQPITFTSAADVTGSTPEAGDWGQIRFLSDTNDNATKLEHVNIRYGKGVVVQSASPTFNYLSISHTLGSAISIDLNASPKGIGNIASNNTINGISVPAGTITGTINWGIKGIPYLVASGGVSVGASPNIAILNPSEVQQSLTVDAVITGSRLAGADIMQFDSPGVTGVVVGAGNNNLQNIRITASANQPVGAVPFSVRTEAGWVRYANGVNVTLRKPNITLSGITPNSMRRSETKSFQITGNYLQGALVLAPSGLTVGNVQTTPTQATFNITAAADAALGAQLITVSNAAIANGAATIPITITHAFPKIDGSTIPAVVKPDGIAYIYNIGITNPDNVAHTFTLSLADTSIVSMSPTSVTIPAGETTVPVEITGHITGATLLTVTSPTLATFTKQILSSNLLDGAVVSPLLSQLVQVNATTPADSIVSIVSTPITVETYLPLGTSIPVVSDVITVDTPVTTNFGPVLSPVIEVIAP